MASADECSINIPGILLEPQHASVSLSQAQHKHLSTAFSMIANFFALSATLFWIAFASPINTRDFIPPSGLAQFQLTTVPNGDNETYSGRFPTSIHTGAGESIAILTPNQNETTTWRKFRRLHSR